MDSILNSSIHYTRIDRAQREELEATMAERDKYTRFVANHLCRLAITLDHDTEFRIEARANSTNGFTTARFATKGGRGLLDRSCTEIGSDDRSRYGILVPVQGDLEVTQFGKTDHYAPGSIALLSTAEPFSYRKLGNNDTVYLFLPRGFGDSRSLRAVDYCGRKMLACTGMRRLTVDAIVGLQREAASMGLEEFTEAARLVAELALLTFSEPADLESGLSPIRAANLACAKRVIRKRHTDPDLSLQDIADECGLSLRHMHELFRQEDCSFRDYLIRERLRSAHRMLALAEPSHATVTEACMASGFSNPSYFSTAFRRAYGVSPRDILLNRKR